MRVWLLAAGLALADDDDRDEHEEHEHEEHEGRRSGGAGLPEVAPVTDPVWTAECGSCHLAYPPGLLPWRSWDRMLGDLSSHFGDDAAVDEATLAKLRAVAAAGAADVAPNGLSRQITRATVGTTPDRISTIPALREEHLEELSTASVTGHPDIRSWSNCAACHPDAAQGRFEDRIRVPR